MVVKIPGHIDLPKLYELLTPKWPISIACDLRKERAYLFGVPIIYL
jgi:hypothetical protein